jgi:hypothetical protein
VAVGLRVCVVVGVEDPVPVPVARGLGVFVPVDDGDSVDEGVAEKEGVEVAVAVEDGLCDSV